MSERRTRRRLITKRNKRVFQLYRRYKHIAKFVRSQYKVNIEFYSHAFDVSVDIDKFLKLRDEACKIYNIVYVWEYRRFVKYVKGGNTYYYTPMMKKERHKSLRKYRQHPLSYYEQIYEDERSLGNQTIDLHR